MTVGHTYFYTNPENIGDCPRTVARISNDEALQLAKETLENNIAAILERPVFVYDEEKGCISWMIELLKNGRLANPVFVTPNYVYERNQEQIDQRIFVVAPEIFTRQLQAKILKHSQPGFFWVIVFLVVTNIFLRQIGLNTKDTGGPLIFGMGRGTLPSFSIVNPNSGIPTVIVSIFQFFLIAKAITFPAKSNIAS